MGSLDVGEFQRRLFEVGKELQNAARSSTRLIHLLDILELCLSMVGQSDSGIPPSMLDAMRPSMIALVSPWLLRHPDADVRLLVLNCLGQLTRITVPTEPYKHDVMKEVLGLMVESFEDLGEMNSPSFARRIFILKIVEEVLLCNLMLDLELDDLLVEMFKHFFAAVSQHGYSEDVYVSMRRIMGLVIDESDDISKELLHVLVINLRREMRDCSPIAHFLAMAVLASHADKLRPYLIAKFSSDQARYHGYHEIVYDICRDGSEEINVDKYTTPTQEVSLRENCTAERGVTSSDNPNPQVANSPFISDKEGSDAKKGEAGLSLVTLFSNTLSFPFPDTRGQLKNRSEDKSEVDVAIPEDTVSKSAKRGRLKDRSDDKKEDVGITEGTVSKSAKRGCVKNQSDHKKDVGIPKDTVSQSAKRRPLKSPSADKKEEDVGLPEDTVSKSAKRLSLRNQLDDKKEEDVGLSEDAVSKLAKRRSLRNQSDDKKEEDVGLPEDTVSKSAKRRSLRKQSDDKKEDVGLPEDTVAKSVKKRRLRNQSDDKKEEDVGIPEDSLSKSAKNVSVSKSLKLKRT